MGTFPRPPFPRVAPLRILSSAMSALRIAAAVVVLAMVAPALATHGVDVSQATMPDAFKCLKSNGYEFAIIRAFESVGRPDSNAPHTIYNAWDGGMSHVDIYFFPDPKAGNAAGQMASMVNYLKQYKIHARGNPPASYGMCWLDIEGTQYWGSQSSNRAFFTDLVNAAKSNGVPLGVYTSESQWGPIMGDWNGGAGLPLWYAHYDGEASFSDFRPFGGWSKPAIKQYRGSTSLCGAGVDENWYPGAMLNTTLSL